ncbi:hypothetical protein C725_2100 [Pacificimonas flava]|uniref:Uncharacterized protein n=2 Tax=Pacificimonas flava TaxID=1234595 RepID=M2T787_9SPHN|nr:hypothetical protein C725_2100 [Pacificimonas flava]
MWVQSKQKWIQLPAGAATMDGQPQTNNEWLQLVGIVD